MKTYHILLLTLAAFSAHLFAADNQQYNPSTARAYEAHLLTFIWPDKNSSEEVKYKNVTSVASLPRFTEGNTEESSSSGANIAQLSIPFDRFKQKIAPHAHVLVDKKWTIIFKNRGDTLRESFHSTTLTNGFPELVGQISIKYGRYLESDIQYQHYLFGLPQSDTANIPDIAQQNTSPGIQPTFVLDLTQKNKTASKKLNYLDHPIIGTLIYFEPISLDDAIQQVALEKLAATPDNIN